MQYIPHVFLVLTGICVGSFLNVCIYRIPQGEGIVAGSSHCMNCKKTLKWYELIPVFSYIALRGKCSKCKINLSLQYPLIELSNGILWLLVYLKFGFKIDTIIGCLFASALLTLAMIDAKTKEIPFGINIFIGILALINVGLHYTQIMSHIWGLLVITIFLLLLFILSKGGAIGGGDVKLMGAAGLYLGLSKTLFAFFLACLIGSIIHIIRMKFFGANRELAMGPYLAISLFISLLYGDSLINVYFSLF